MKRGLSDRRARPRRRGTPVGLLSVLNAIARTAASLCEADNALIVVDLEEIEPLTREGSARPIRAFRVLGLKSP